MALIDVSGANRGLKKLGNAIVFTVQPVANIIEIASTSSNAWIEQHAADIQAKTERKNAVREIVSADLLRKAKATAKQSTIDTNVFERSVQTAVGIDAFKDRIHEAKMAKLVNISDSTVDQLATKENLTDADILRAVKVGSMAPTTEAETTTDAFDISRFKSAE